MKIFIITDGNNELGMGHIYQSATLAGYLRKRNAALDISFLTKSSNDILKLIESNGFKAGRFDSDEEIYDKINKEKPYRVIFDKLDVSPELAQKIKALKIKLIIFTNLTAANQYADMAVLADYGSEFKNIFNRHEVTGRVEIFGPKYWLLRPEFAEFSNKGKQHAAEIKKIMLIFGGSDPCNYSTSVTASLLQMKCAFDITLVLGGAFAHEKELEEMLSRNSDAPGNVNVVRNMKNVAETMWMSDLVFASPGLSFFEALAAGTPVIGFYQNEIQRAEYDGILTTYRETDIPQIPEMIMRKSFIYPEDRIIAEMEIGKGTDQMLSEILN